MEDFNHPNGIVGNEHNKISSKVKTNPYESKCESKM